MANYNWYKTSYRRNLVDMHIEDWNAEFLSKFDAQAYFDCLKRGQVQSPMIYLQSHVGLCNWPTQTGRTHRAFAAENKMKELLELCHAGGMDVVGYYSLIFNNWAYDAHPSWRMVDPTGKFTREKGVASAFKNRYGTVCPNNPEYRKFVADQLKELLDIYDIDGLFLDMAFWPTICFCDSCKERYYKETGEDVLFLVDWEEPDWLQFQKKREEWMSEFAFYCADEARRLRPGISVEHNFATAPMPWLVAANGGSGEASDFVGGDLYRTYHEQFLTCKLFYEYTNNQPFEFMTSRCDPQLSEHTTTKSLDALKTHNYITLAHHGAMLFIDAIDPAGTLNPVFYDRLGQVFAESEPYEKYMSGTMVSDVAVLNDMNSKMRHLPKEGSDPYSYPQLEAVTGGTKALADGNYLYTVLPNCRKERIADKKLAIVTEAPFLPDEDIENLVAYVQNGGNLYISGATNPKLAQKLLGLEFLGWTEETVTYIAPTAEGQQHFGEMYNAEYPVAFSDRQMLVRNPLEKQELATITLPYTNPGDTEVFASIHANPPGARTAFPSIVYGEYGQGKIIWSAAAFEAKPQKAYKDMFLKLIALLYGGESVLSSTAPPCVQFTLFDDPGNGRLLLHAVNVQEPEPYIKVSDFCVSLRTDKSVRSVHLLPCNEEVPFSFHAGALSFEVKDMELFRMYELNY